jgi:hypothetical protein
VPGPFASGPSVHLQPFLTIEGGGVLGSWSHPRNFAAHQHEQAAVAEPPAASIAERGMIHPEHRTRPRLAQLERTLQVRVKAFRLTAGATILW